MEINKHIVFCDKDEAELICYFEKNNIIYDKGENSSVLDIYESDPHWGYIEKYIQERNLFCLSETIFSKKELQSAEWMRVRSIWHNGYPQPEGAFKYRIITYSDENYCEECGEGLVQTDSFRIRKAPKWNNRHFMMLNWVADEFFVDDIAKTLLENEYPFLSFREVKNTKGDAVFSGVFQVIIPELTKTGLIEKQIGIRETLICPCCGEKKFHPNGIGMLQYKRDTFENAKDIVKSAEWFGWGHGADRIIIINQKVYQFIISNNLDRSLEFSPIELI